MEAWQTSLFFMIIQQKEGVVDYFYFQKGIPQNKNESAGTRFRFREIIEDNFEFNK